MSYQLGPGKALVHLEAVSGHDAAHHAAGAAPAPYADLGRVISTLIDTEGYTPHQTVEVKGRFGKRSEQLVPAPIVLGNGAVVTGRVMLEPAVSDPGYNARKYVNVNRGRSYGLVGATYPYFGSADVNSFYGARSIEPALVADRITAPGAQPGTELYVVSAGFAPNRAINTHEYGFRPARTMLLAPHLGTAVMRTFPDPGRWSGMHERQVSLDEAAHIGAELGILLNPQAPDMQPCEPGTDGFPDVSRQPSHRTLPYDTAADYSVVWVSNAASA